MHTSISREIPYYGSESPDLQPTNNPDSWSKIIPHHQEWQSDYAEHNYPEQIPRQSDPYFVDDMILEEEDLF